MSKSSPGQAVHQWFSTLLLLLLVGIAPRTLADPTTNLPAAGAPDTNAAEVFVFSTHGLAPQSGLIFNGTNWVAGSDIAPPPAARPVEDHPETPVIPLTPSRFRLETNYPAFSIVIVPDTQSIMLQENSDLWKQTMEWVELMKPLNTVAVLGVGDCVDTSIITNQWLTFLYGLQFLTNTPVLLAAGNHDYAYTGRNYTNFNNYISPDFYASRPWWNSTGHGFRVAGQQTEMYITVTNGPLKLLFGTVEFGPTTNQVLWFFNVCASHPDHLCFLTTHNYMNRDGSLNRNSQVNNSTNASYSPITYGLPDSCDGPSLFALLKGLPNLGLIVCGHQICAPNEAFRTDLGTRGNLINGQFINYQCDQYSEPLNHGEFMSRLKVITFEPGGAGLARTFDAAHLIWTNANYDHTITLTGSRY